jgi:hypothetical protein
MRAVGQKFRGATAVADDRRTLTPSFDSRYCRSRSGAISAQSPATNARRHVHGGPAEANQDLGANHGDRVTARPSVRHRAGILCVTVASWTARRVSALASGTTTVVVFAPGMLARIAVFGELTEPRSAPTVQSPDQSGHRCITSSCDCSRRLRPPRGQVRYSPLAAPRVHRHAEAQSQPTMSARTWVEPNLFRSRRSRSPGTHNDEVRHGLSGDVVEIRRERQDHVVKEHGQRSSVRWGRSR